MEEVIINKILLKNLRKTGALKAFGEIISSIINKDAIVTLKDNSNVSIDVLDEVKEFLKVNGLYVEPVKTIMIDPLQITIDDVIAEVKEEQDAIDSLIEDPDLEKAIDIATESPFNDSYGTTKIPVNPGHTLTTSNPIATTTENPVLNLSGLTTATAVLDPTTIQKPEISFEL